MLPWAINLLSAQTINRVTDADGVAALSFTLWSISQDRSLAHRALEGGKVFDALASSLKEHGAHEGVAEGAGFATHHLVDDKFAMRTLPVDAGLPAALVRAARTHERSEKVALATAMALVRLHALCTYLIPDSFICKTRW